MSQPFRFSSTEPEEVEALVKWATEHPGVEAFPVYDYVPLPVADKRGANADIGPLNGVTIQWDITDSLVLETGEGESNVVHPVANGAVHVRPGQTVTATENGFAVEGVPDVVQAALDDLAALAEVTE